MVGFICKNCGYRFDSKLNQEAKPCQYCGKKAVSRELSAEELLEEEE